MILRILKVLFSHHFSPIDDHLVVIDALYSFLVLAVRSFVRHWVCKERLSTLVTIVVRMIKLIGYEIGSDLIC